MGVNKQELYTKIEFRPGSTIEECVESLLNHNKRGKLVYGEFNGIPLYSRSVTIDSAYVLLTGKTRAESEKLQKEYFDALKKKESEHKEKIPELSKIWMSKGREVLSEDKWGLWDSIVPIRLNDLYGGTELGDCLAVVEVLNTGGTLEEAKDVLDGQGHSGMSYELVRSMVRSFADRGKEFLEFTVR